MCLSRATTQKAYTELIGLITTILEINETDIVNNSVSLLDKYNELIKKFTINSANIKQTITLLCANDTETKNIVSSAFAS